MLIGVIGPCSAGKSTLIQALGDHGYSARHIAQEHSYVPDMWRRIVNPDVLIYLDVSYTVSMRRRPLEMDEKEFFEEVSRLSHAREHADLYLHTDNLTPQEVLDQVLGFLKSREATKRCR
jgi:deoxyadenosine/deoxycytidine kinase